MRHSLKMLITHTPVHRNQNLLHGWGWRATKPLNPNGTVVAECWVLFAIFFMASSLISFLHQVMWWLFLRYDRRPFLFGHSLHRKQLWKIWKLVEYIFLGGWLKKNGFTFLSDASKIFWSSNFSACFSLTDFFGYRNAEAW